MPGDLGDLPRQLSPLPGHLSPQFDPDRRDFDAWFAYTGETAAPRPVTRREDTLLEETLYEEDRGPDRARPRRTTAVSRRRAGAPPPPGQPAGAQGAFESQLPSLSA